MRRGFVASLCAVSFGSLGSLWMIHEYAGSMSGVLLSNVAQIAATLLVAYAVETSWLLKVDRRRGEDSENWAGIAAGVGSAGLLGIAFAIALSGQDGQRTMLESFLIGWTFVSTGMLGLIAALLPYAMYGWVHALNAEYAEDD